MPLQECTLIYVEGDTEEIFYKGCKNKWFKSAPTKIININGNFNIVSKILDDASLRADNMSCNFHVSICIDRESRYGKAPIDIPAIRNELSPERFLGVNLYEAVQDIESWFFHDIDSIYKFLRTPTSSRNMSRFTPVERFNNQHLSRLFRENGKEYRKGRASQNFIDQLDLSLIRQRSPVLNDFVAVMESRSN